MLQYNAIKLSYSNVEILTIVKLFVKIEINICMLPKVIISDYNKYVFND